MSSASKLPVRNVLSHSLGKVQPRQIKDVIGRNATLAGDGILLLATAVLILCFWPATMKGQVTDLGAMEFANDFAFRCSSPDFKAAALFLALSVGAALVRFQPPPLTHS